MDPQTDQQLLRDYAERRSEAAFTELVRRHLDLVHSAAFRMTGDAESAKDVAQGVFMALAEQAARLAGHPVLSGWLHTTARNLAAKAVRAAVCRQSHEQKAAAMNNLLAAPPDAPWETIAPVLDAALGELNEAERDAVLLRYFEKRSAADMGQILGVSTEAAQKRVNRAVERLRDSFAKRGVAAGAGGLAIIISANAVQAAPVGLALSISTAVLSATAVTSTTLLAATKTIAMTTLQKTIVTATVVVLTGAGLYENRQAAQLQDRVRSLQQQDTLRSDQLDRLQAALADTTNRLTNVLAENARLKSNADNTELLRLRGEVARLKPGKAGSDPEDRQQAMRAWLVKQEKLRQATNQYPDKVIPEIQLISEEDWLDAAKDARFDGDGAIRRSLANLRRLGENAFASLAADAVRKYYAANGGKYPTTLAELQPYFKTPVAPAILQRWEIRPKSELPNPKLGGDWESVITGKAPVDPDLDCRWAIGLNIWTYDHYQDEEVRRANRAIDSAMDAYAAAHNGNKPDQPSELLPYLKTPEGRAALEKMMKSSQEGQP